MSESKGRVAVVVDSAASLPAGLGEDQQLHVVPMQLTIEGKTYLDGRDLTPTEFYRMQQGMTEAPTTSSPSPTRFLEAFRDAAKEASSVLCLTVSPKFSSAYDSARTAALDAEEILPRGRVAVVDSESAAGGQGLIAMEALRAARRGAGLEEAVAAARSVASRVLLLAFLDTLYYVWRSGRVPRVAHLGATLLRIKPLFELSHGEVRTVARPRTAPKAADLMLRLMWRRAGLAPVHATVMHADALDAAERLRERVESDFPCEELFISEFSPVMGAHTGPGLLGVAFWTEEDGTEG